jgi:tetratricopeptide (TPR) repeat protein
VPSKSVPASPAVARLLRERRESLGLTLRSVETLTGDGGNPIPHSTLARIEQGRLDPGVRRLQQLLRLYGLSSQAAGELLDLEALAGAVPFERDPIKLRDLALAAWHDGRVSDALACFLAFRERASRTPADRTMRHEAILAFAVAAASLGKHQLSRQMLDELLLDRPEPGVLAKVLVQQSVLWRSLGSQEAAMAFLDRATAHLRHGDYRQAGLVHHQRGLIEIDLLAFDAAAGSLTRALRNYRRAPANYDQARVLISIANLEYQRGRAERAAAAARRAARFARSHGFARLRLFALLEESRALQLGGSVSESRLLLREVLADSVSDNDNVIRFHAHYYQWKAELTGGDSARAEIELREAGYFVRFVDQTSAEASEVRTRLAISRKKLGR